MNERDYFNITREQDGRINANERERYVSNAFPILMRKVYVWMTLALAITGLAAWVVANNFMDLLMGNSIVMWVLIIAELGLVFGISGMIHKLSLTTATLLFVLFSIINGVTLSSIFLIYEIGTIAKVFFITSGTFAAMAFFGYTTKRDLSFIGRILFMALIGIIIATLVNVFFTKSEGFDLIICYIGVLIFVGLTAWDSQKIKKMLSQAEQADETYQKLALLGSLSLYLDFINLFLYLLRIFDRD